MVFILVHRRDLMVTYIAIVVEVISYYRFQEECIVHTIKKKPAFLVIAQKWWYKMTSTANIVSQARLMRVWPARLQIIPRFT